MNPARVGYPEWLYQKAASSHDLCQGRVILELHYNRSSDREHASVTRAFLSTFAAALLCTPAFAAGQAPAAQSVSGTHTDTNMAVADVVVTDSRHIPVHSLTVARLHGS